MEPISFDQLETERPARFWRVVLQFVGLSDQKIVRYIENPDEVKRLLDNSSVARIHSVDEYQKVEPKSATASAAHDSNNCADKS